MSAFFCARDSHQLVCETQCSECAAINTNEYLAVLSAAEQSALQPTINEAWVEQWRQELLKCNCFWDGQRDEINHLCDLALDGISLCGRMQ